MSEELKPCPCCGRIAMVQQVPFKPETENSGGYYVECTVCGLTTQLMFSVMDDCRPILVEQWNRRAQDSELAALRTKLEEREVDMHMRIRAEYDKTVADSWRAECDKLRTRAEEAERKVYVPGLWRCAKCKLDLIATTLSQQGQFANNNPQSCPNGCGPMWRVTERDQRQEAQMLFEREFNARQEAERKLAEAARWSNEWAAEVARVKAEFSELVVSHTDLLHQLQRALDAEKTARAEGMDEAAKVCDVTEEWQSAIPVNQACAKAIRAKMKEQK